MSFQLLLCFISRQLDYKFTKTGFPKPEEGKTIVLYQEAATAEGTPFIGFVSDDSYKRIVIDPTIENVMKYAEKPVSMHFAEVEAAAADTAIFDFDSDATMDFAVVKTVDFFLGLAPDDAAVKENLKALKNTFLTGGKYKSGRIVRGKYEFQDANFRTIRARVDTPGTTTATEVVLDWDAKTRDDIMKLIDLITPAIKYEGFNPRLLRKKFIAIDPDVLVVMRHLIMCFSAYAHVGNTIGKLTIKRNDAKIGGKLSAAVSKLGVDKVATTKDGFTLPRIAISFMPEYLIYRRFLAGELQSQTTSKIDTVYKDIIFDGCPDIRSMLGYGEFHLEFASYIDKKEKDVDLKNEKFLKMHSKWQKITMTGYQSDVRIHANMDRAIKLVGVSKAVAYDHIMDNILGYKADVSA